MVAEGTPVTPRMLKDGPPLDEPVLGWVGSTDPDNPSIVTVILTPEGQRWVEENMTSVARLLGLDR